MEPIPEAVKAHLPKPVKPGKYRPIPPPQKLIKEAKGSKKEEGCSRSLIQFQYK